MVSYCGAKAALINSSKVIAKEYSSTGLRINTISPSDIKTPMTQAGEIKNFVENNDLEVFKKVKEFLSHLPAAWDDTKLLSGYPGTYIVLARRKGKRWYISGINGTNEKRDICFTLEHLGLKGSCKCSIIKDGNIDKDFSTSEVNINTKGTVNISCLPMGGFVIVTE